MKEKLGPYKEKRHFDHTPEPEDGSASGSKRLFVIQKHDASHLHYDFRLEHNGVLLSWAVPKGPSVDRKVKRLAVHVEDHPVSYGSFAGTIPKGNYGAGTVEVWDTGWWSPIGDVDAGMAEGVLKFELHGNRLHGRWALIRLKDGDKNWLLIKEKDEPADAGSDTTSPGKAVNSKLDPHQFRPQLATRATSAPESDDWLHEIKYDGYRILAWHQAGSVHLMSRNGLDWTTRFSDIASAIKEYIPEGTTIDGEIVVFSGEGVSDFGALQRWLKDGNGSDPQYVCFDLTVDQGKDISGLPLSDRKKRLEALVAKAPKEAAYFLRYSTHMVGHGKSMTLEACKKGLEGVVSKKFNSKYVQGRTSAWIKSKCYQEDEFVIGGYTKPIASRIGFGALLLGQYDSAGKLQYAGKVGSGFDDAALIDLKKKMDGVKAINRPFDGASKLPDALQWTKPVLVAQIRYPEITNAGMIRQGVFTGLREDKLAQEITPELTMQNLPVSISHPERILFPLSGLTKLDLAEYYYRVADRILPYIKNRPVSIVRCPEGIEEPCFFQKHPGPGMAEGLARALEGEEEPLLAVSAPEDLLALVQFGAIEFHVWGSTFAEPDKPDMMIFDLDPGPGVKWKTTVQAATVLREYLKSVEMESFAKISGGKGVHVVVPIVPGSIDWEVKGLAKAIAETFDKLVPGQFVTVMSKAKREKKIFIDYLRNGRGSTSVVPYSVRSNPEASVSIPIDWNHLADVKDPRQFTVQNVETWLLPQKDDPWREFFHRAHAVKPEIWEKLGVKAPSK